jgi:Fe-Mn family superoxide dismutase
MALTRRKFMQMTLASAGLLLAPKAGLTADSPIKPTKEALMFTLPPLPYDKTALEPNISAKTLEFHHGKHHKAYVDKTNELVAGTPLEGKSLEEVILAAAKDDSKKVLFNNAAQVWNHTFFWNSMKPAGGGKPAGKLAAQIEKDFGSYEKFAEEFKNAGVTQFGSGWAWLVADKSGKLSVTKTPNAELPLVTGNSAILTCDVWEHAYYLDYQNRRPDFLQTFLDKLANWEFAASNYEGLSAKKAA